MPTANGGDVAKAVEEAKRHQHQHLMFLQQAMHLLDPALPLLEPLFKKALVVAADIKGGLVSGEAARKAVRMARGKDKCPL
jgi:hypothetical protein